MNKRIYICLLIIITILIINIYLTNNNLNKIEDGFNNTLTNSMYNNIIEENNSLKEYLNLKNIPKDYIFTSGRFINLYDEIIINKGSTENIKKGNAVIAKDTLVGFVKRTYKHSSIVNMLNNYTISVRINNEYGILKEEQNKLIVTGISSAKIGDFIYTSGLTNVIGNLYIGEVSKIQNNKIYITRKIKPNDCKYLLIIGDKDAK